MTLGVIKIAAHSEDTLSVCVKHPITTTTKVKTYYLQAASYDTCSLQPITAYRPIDGISSLTERAPDDRHHGRGAANFLAII